MVTSRPFCWRHPTEPYGTTLHTYLLVMSLNGAKCNLGKVKLETMLASGLPLVLGAALQ